MATEELVTEQFQFLGIDLQVDVLRKCVSLCEEHDVDAERFVELWMAFSLSHLNGASPTVENLQAFERKEFSKRGGRVAPAGGGTLIDIVHDAPRPSQPDDDLVSKYLTTSPKRTKLETDPVLMQNELKPATYSPTVGHSAKYASRTNSGSVVHSFGNEKLLDTLAKPNNVNNILDLSILQVPNDEGDLYKKPLFGFELLPEKASIFDAHINYLAQCIMKKVDVSEVVSVRHKSQNEVYIAGRVECDADARLNPKSVVLQGTWAQSLSLSVPIDLDQVKQYSLFRGQVVVMRGTNPRGDKFIAHEVYSDAQKTVSDHKADLINAFKGTMSLVVASGPYTTSDNLGYEPLKDFVQYVGSHKPHIVIMTGPFVDTEHTNVKDNSMAETFRSFFDKLLDNLAEITNASPMTKIYIVSSSKDAFHMNFYPTPPYSSRRKHANIHFVPDPTTLNINGIIIGVTSTDVLMHISQEEISFGMGGDKLSRLSGHVLSQQNYYPLYAPPTSPPLDAALWDAHAHMNLTPHVLILPSNFRYFVKKVNSCVVVNPEHLTKGTSGGTFARLLVNVDDNTTDVSDCIAAQIIRI